MSGADMCITLDDDFLFIYFGRWSSENIIDQDHYHIDIYRVRNMLQAQHVTNSLMEMRQSSFLQEEAVIWPWGGDQLRITIALLSSEVWYHKNAFSD